MDTTPFAWIAYHLKLSIPLSDGDINCLIAELLAKVDACAHNQHGNNSHRFTHPVKFFTLDFCVSDLSTHKDF